MTEADADISVARMDPPGEVDRARPGYLVEVPTDDGALLDGWWIPPVEHGSGIGLVHLHGKGGNFYSGPFRWLMGLLPQDIAHLSVNMRCHDLGWTNPSGYQLGWEGPACVGGGAWEDLSLGHVDVGGAIAWLRSSGITTVVVVGHSSGGFYAVDFRGRGGSADALVLLSPLLSNRAPLATWFPDPADAASAELRARQMLECGHGHRLIEVPTWYFAISARSLVQRFEEPANLFDERLAASGDVPVLLVFGSREPNHERWSALTKRNAGRMLSAPVDSADHYYADRKAEVVTAVRAFLDGLGR